MYFEGGDMTVHRNLRRIVFTLTMNCVCASLSLSLSRPSSWWAWSWCNADCSRLVVDGWLELRDPDGALKVLSSALSLRADWEHLLQARIGQGQGARGPREPVGCPAKTWTN